MQLKKKQNPAQEALAAYQREDYSLARKLAGQGVKTAPDDVSLWLILGNVFFIEQDYAQADKYYQKILTLQPGHREALINHGEALLRQKKFAPAAEVAAALSDARLMAKIAFEQEDFAAAEDGFSIALQSHRGDFWSWNLLSQAAQKNGHYQRALEAAWQAVEQSSGADSQHLNLAYALYEISLETDVQTVLPFLQKWHRKYAGNGIVEQSWHAFFPGADFAKSDSFYVRSVFDNFADSFEQTLAALGYCVPRLIAEEIAARYLNFLPSEVDILDAGCGTGLCAPHLDSLFTNYRLTGVDLSPQMLRKAAAKKLYSQLEEADLEDFLPRHKKAFDLIVAADVLTYFGALENLLAQAFSALRKNGVLVFSASAGDDAEKGWQQHLSGRFLHSRRYLRTVLLQSGFSTIFFTDSVLRREGEKDVRGWIVSAVKK